MVRHIAFISVDQMMDGLGGPFRRVLSRRCCSSQSRLARDRPSVGILSHIVGRESSWWVAVPLHSLTIPRSDHMGVPQVVHHLFPAISHTHYPAIAPIVMRTCQEFNIPYKVYPTVRTVVISLRHLCHMYVVARSLWNPRGRICSLTFGGRHSRDLHLKTECAFWSFDSSCLTPVVCCCAQFLSAVGAHFKHLRSMGHSSSAMLTIPSLASIG